MWVDAPHGNSDTAHLLRSIDRNQSGESMRKVIALLAALVFASLSGSAMAQLELQNKSLVESSFDAWRNGTGSPYDLLAEDVAWTIVGKSDASRTYPSRKEFITEVIQPFNARMSAPLKPTIRNLYATGDAVVILFDAVGVARDGKEYANTYAWFFEMRGGKVVKAHAFFDSITFNDLWRRVQPQQP